MSYVPLPASQRSDKRPQKAKQGGPIANRRLHVGRFETTPLGAVLLGFALLAAISLAVSFFTRNFGALIFWTLVEVAAAFGFFFDRNRNREHSKPAPSHHTFRPPGR
ncbi:MAG: hypothetical protein AABX89_01790 [Candidatus Thermoplasmatota archaeon]